MESLINFVNRDVAATFFHNNNVVDLLSRLGSVIDCRKEITDPILKGMVNTAGIFVINCNTEEGGSTTAILSNKGL